MRPRLVFGVRSGSFLSLKEDSVLQVEKLLYGYQPSGLGVPHAQGPHLINLCPPMVPGTGPIYHTGCAQEGKKEYPFDLFSH